MNRLSYVVTLFVLFLYPNVTQAEPSKTVEYLINEPVSMLDLGILKLNRKLDKSDIEFSYKDKSLKKTMGIAYYDFQKNRMLLEFRLDLNTDLFRTFDYKNETLRTEEWDPKTVCKDQLSRVREEFGFSDDNSKKGYSSNVRSILSIANHFAHSGYKNKNVPKNLTSEIENISYVEIDIRDDCAMCVMNRTLAKCEGSLYGKEVLFHDK
tara:strand:+ start:946 stop:1572 length:627 start_codon:yes stop_codon:yes gene_type:complete